MGDVLDDFCFLIQFLSAPILALAVSNALSKQNQQWVPQDVAVVQVPRVCESSALLERVWDRPRLRGRLAKF